MKLDHLNAEVRAVHQRQQQLKASIENQTQDLLDERELALQKLQDEFEKSIRPLKLQVETLNRDLNSLKESYATLNGNHVALVGEITGLRGERDSLKETITTDTNHLTDLKIACELAQEQLDGLNRQVSGLTGQIEDLKADVAQHEHSKEAIIQAIDESKAEYEANLATNEQEIDELKAQRLAVFEEIKEAQNGLRIEREDLAKRKLTADARDENLRMREFALTRNQETIRRNANLLNL